MVTLADIAKEVGTSVNTVSRALITAAAIAAGAGTELAEHNFDLIKKRQALYEPVLRYLHESPSRIPFGDWYDADSGKIEHFFNRTVQGGIFAPLLKKVFDKKQNEKKRKNYLLLLRRSDIIKSWNSKIKRSPF